MIGVVLSLVLLLHRMDHPHGAVLGRSPDGARYGDLAAHPDATPVDGVLIYRLDAPLIFVNVDVVIDDVEAKVRAAGPLRALILDLESVSDIDTTGVDALLRLREMLDDENVSMTIAHAHAWVLRSLEQDGALDALTDGRVYSSVRSAVEALRAQSTT